MAEEITERKQLDREHKERLQRFQKYNNAFIKLAKLSLLYQDDSEATLNKITEVSANTLDVGRVNIWLYNDDKSKIICIENYERYNKKHSKGLELVSTDYPNYFKALRKERFIVVDDAHEDKRTNEFAESYFTKFGISSLLDASIMLGGEVVGVICHEQVGELRHWTEEDQSFVGSIADLVSMTINWDERKKTEKALGESEKKYRDLYENAPIMYHSLDSKGVIIDCNLTELKTLGYKKEEMVGKKIFNFLTDDSTKKIKKLMRKLHRGEDVEDIELQFKHKNGKVLDALLNSSPVKDEKGKFIYCRSVMLDITARKRTEENVQKLSSAVDQTGEMIFITDVEGVIEYINPAFKKVTGYSSEDLIGQNPSFLKSGKHPRKFYTNLWNTILSGKDFHVTLINQKKNGEIYYEDKIISPMRDAEGNITHFVSTGRDITEDRRVQEKIRLFQSLSETINKADSVHKALMGIIKEVCEVTFWAIGEAWLPSNDRTFLELGAWFCKDAKFEPFKKVTEKTTLILGEGLPGKAWASKKPESMRDVSKDLHFLRKNAAREVGLKTGVSIPILADDEVVIVLIFFLTEVSKVDEDFTDFITAVANQLGSLIQRKLAEEELKKKHKELELANEELKIAFEHEIQLRDKLIKAQKLATLGEMAAKIAHEINNPLTVIMGHTQMALMSEHPERLTTSLTQINEKALQIKNLTRGYMNLAKSEESAMTEIVLGDVIHSTVSSLEPLGQLKHVELKEDYAENEPKILGDFGKLEQVFRNLILNAVDAISDTSKRLITVGTNISANKDGVEAFVSDTGVGIEPEIIDKIFEDFYTTKGDELGTGLGLAITKEIVESVHAGKLLVESTPGKGTTFKVVLPMIDLALKKKKLLIVDDEAYVLQTFADYLRRIGFNVRTASNGKEALDIYSRLKPDLIISDIQMPIMDGFELLDKVKESNPDQRFIMITGYLLKKGVIETLKQKNIFYLKKPISLEDELLNAVKEQLEIK